MEENWHLVGKAKGLNYTQVPLVLARDPFYPARDTGERNPKGCPAVAESKARLQGTTQGTEEKPAGWCNETSAEQEVEFYFNHGYIIFAQGGVGVGVGESANICTLCLLVIDSAHVPSLKGSRLWKPVYSFTDTSYFSCSNHASVQTLPSADFKSSCFCQCCCGS